MTAIVPPIADHAPDIVTRVREGGLSGSRNILLGIGAIALLVTLVLGFTEHSEAAPDAEHGLFSMGFLSSYLTAWIYGVSLCIGALFFVLIQHLTRAGWSVTVRRLAEHVAANIWVFVPLSLPLLLGYETLWGAWVHASPTDEVVAGKSSYLNVTFFFVRFAIYFALWTYIARWFRARSLEQDETGDPSLSLKMSYRAAPSVLVFALTVTFASIDWMMTLDPHWYSTIFVVVFFAGSFVAFLALSILLFQGLGKAGYLKDTVNTEHYHDLGKLLFAFIVFWTYVSFSQFFLIWFANIPEETAWYALRQKDGWDMVFNILALGHFLVPFAFLLGRHVKRNKFGLGIGAAYMLALHWVDLHFYIAPSAAHHGGGHGGPGGSGVEDAAHGHASWADHLAVTDATATVAMLCLVAGLALHSLRSHPLIPVRDPRLKEALHFHNI